MPGARLGLRRLGYLLALSAAVFLPGLGSSGRLSYHEAFVAQGAREILASGGWGYPTIGGRPWLEKPPLPWWLTAALGRWAGGVDEVVARLPAVLAATAMVLGVAVLAARHYGPDLGLLAGAVQATTAWTVRRGRLAEADVLLACLITWAIVAFDRMREEEPPAAADRAPGWRPARRAFFVLLGATSLVKGIGFGAVLILAIVAVAVLWGRDPTVLRRLRFPAGWIAATALALAWPLAMVARHGQGALALWTRHVTDRLAAHPGEFAGEPWWEYVPGLLIQAMPWTPLALLGAGSSLRRAVSGFGIWDFRFWIDEHHRHPIQNPGSKIPNVRVIAGDRLLWAWSAAPLAVLAPATVKNAHYALAAQVPWSIWAALGLVRLGGRLRRRGWTPARLRRWARGGFAVLGLAYGLGFWLLGPRLDRRGAEWAFYESAARRLPPGAPLALLYDDWDRNPYASPFGAFPHDLAVRLFYLGRPACWHFGAEDLVARGDRSPRAPHHAPRTTLYVIGRDRDRPALDRLGRVTVLARGPSRRWDRAYVLFRIAPGSAPLDPSAPLAHRGGPGVPR